MVPTDRMLPIHYPRYKADIMGWTTQGNTLWPAAASNISVNNAFNGSLQSRIGFYDDNFAGDANHWGFFYGWPFPEKAMVMNDGLYVFTEGELSGATAFNETYGESELKKYHFSAYQKTGDGSTEVIAAWKNNGQHDRIARNLGYRFRLVSINIPQFIDTTDTFTMSINMVNDGYSRIMNPRKVEIIFRNKTTRNKYVIDIDGDGRGNRFWLPGPAENKILDISMPMPDGVNIGDYDLILNLPDPYPSIHDRPEYSIRLANVGIWEASTGYNILYSGFKIGAYNDIKTIKGIKGISIYPNPVNRQLTISYELLHESNVKISLYDSFDKEIRQILNEEQNSGLKSLNVNTATLQDGMYIVKTMVDKNLYINKLIIKKQI